jgi:hypothetical protein
MGFTLFADESGIDSSYRCYGIGALTVPDTRLDSFIGTIEGLAETHGVVGEVKWKKLGNSHGQVNFGIDLAKHVLAEGYRFDAIVVTKNRFRNWTLNGPEEAFYQSYTYLVKHAVSQTPSAEYSVVLDDRQDSYDKNEAVVQTIANHMLAKAGSSTRITTSIKVNSRAHRIIQAADFLIGAITASHNQRLDVSAPLNPAKALAISRISEVLGWDDLCYDTYPGSTFNVWRFPSECRCQFGASRSIKLDVSVPFIKTADLLHNTRLKKSG